MPHTLTTEQSGSSDGGGRVELKIFWINEAGPKFALNPNRTMVAVVEALRDVRVDREIIRLPSWIGAEAAQLIDGISRGAGGSWDAQIKLHSPSDARSMRQSDPQF